MYYLNTKHNNIQFTCEIENENKILPFLDLNINRTETGFVTSIYRKNTFTGLGLHYLSFEPFRYKINAIKTLIYRAFNICSTHINFHTEIKFLEQFFHGNGFPGAIFHKYVKKFLDNVYVPVVRASFSIFYVLFIMNIYITALF